MWLLFARAPPPDAPYWPGRRWLAAIDAVVWPGVGWGALSCAADQGGLIVAFAMALLPLSAGRRLLIALFRNHRYHFTTSRWGPVLGYVLAVGFALKVGVSA